MNMIERVARAIGKLDGIPDELWETSVPHARAAIAAMREPDAEMRLAGFSVRNRGGGLEDTYQAMIDSALQEPQP